MARKRRGRHEGSLYQRADGKWVAARSLGRDADGKRLRKIAYGRTKQEAQAKLQELLAGVGATTRTPTVGELCDRFLRSKSNIEESTAARYEQLARLHIKPLLGLLPADKLTPALAEKFYSDSTDRGASLDTIRKAGGLLYSVMGYGVRLGVVAANPIQHVERPRVSKQPMKVWTPDQASTFLEAARSDRLYSLYVLALTTGLREGELFALQWRDFDSTGGFLTVCRSLMELNGRIREKTPKTAAGVRRVDLPAFVVEVLLARREQAVESGHAVDDSPICCNTRGGYLRRPNVAQRSYQPIIARAGVPSIRFHDLRHTAATLLLAAGVHPKIVSERLGHASVKITLDTYSHVLPTMQAEAARKIHDLLS